VPVSGHEFRVAEKVSDEHRIVRSCDEAPWRMTQTVSRTDRSPAATLVSLSKRCCFEVTDETVGEDKIARAHELIAIGKPRKGRGSR
jgi:hypothetical protein